MSAVNDIHWDEPGRLDTLLTKIDPAIALLLTKALTGGELDFDEGLALARTRGHEMEALVLAADLVRRERVGDVITYVVNRNINFTNICFIGCRFCAFSRAPREKDAYFTRSKRFSAGLSKRGSWARAKCACKGACRAIWILTTIATCSARSNKRLPICTSTRFLRWRLFTA